MKNRISLWALLFVLLLGASVSCTQEEGVPDIIDGLNELELNYNVIESKQADLTRAVTGTTNENRVTSIYTLFFEDGGTNDYIGCMVSTTNSSGNQSVGSSRVGVPGGRDINEAFRFIVIANLEGYMDKQSKPTLADYLDEVLLTGKTYAEAKVLLEAHFSDADGIKPVLLMSAETSKAANTKTINVDFTRVVCRVDVDNRSTTPFRLVTAEVWNARDEAYIVDRGSATPQVGGHSHYTNNVQSTVGTKIEGGLYFLPNVSMAPTPNDKVTTCLIISGEYNNSGNVTYYRINISTPSQMQVLDRNHIYTIKITDVLSAGCDDKDEAYDDTDLRIKYTVNDWDDEYNGGAVVDEYGNKLELSKYSVIFSNTGGQEEEIEVIFTPGKTNPITDTFYTIDDPLTGTHATSFEAEMVSNLNNGTFKVKVPTANITNNDKTATVTVRWGTLAAKLDVKQLSPSSQVQGLRAMPSNVWFPKDATTGNEKQFSLDVLGNYAHITDPQTDIQMVVIWGTGGSDWFTVSFDQDLGSGVYRYKVYPTPLTDPLLTYRDATIKLSTVVNGVALSATVYVKQSAEDEEQAIDRRQLQVTLWRSIAGTYEDTDYQNLGSMTTAFSAFMGFPQDKISTRDLHFSLNEKRDIKYKVELTSSQDWWIVPKEQAASRLDFSMISYTGSGFAQTHTIWVTANMDMVNDASNPESGAWKDAWFDICFENGDVETFHCHQAGVLGTLSGKTYYYETVFMKGRYWLDRNLGATSSGFYNAVTGDGESTAMGAALGRASAVCPKGFRLPKKTSTNVDEWDWVSTFAVYSGTDHVEHPLSWYVEYSASPVMNWWIPNANSFSENSGLTPYFTYESQNAFVLNGARVSNSAGTQGAGKWYNCIKGSKGVRQLTSAIAYGGGAGGGGRDYNNWAGWRTISGEAIASQGWYHNYGLNAAQRTAGSLSGAFYARCIRDDN